MNFCFDNKTTGSCRELCSLSKAVQTSAETVVPDTGEDIASVASVMSRVVLKSKERTPEGVCVTGEVSACCICITEKGGISDIRVSKGFEMSFEAENVSEDAQTQIFFARPTVQARLVNPRKLSVSFEICGTLRVFGDCETVVDSLLPADISCEGLHLKYDEAETAVMTCAAEKTFTVTEQFELTVGTPVSDTSVWESCEFRVSDVQTVGTKAIIRGSLDFTGFYMSVESALPVTCNFSSPFSQIIDTGTEETEFSSAHIEKTAVYADIRDAVNGGKILNVEVHALAELRGWGKRKVRYISDLYSNLIPASCVFEKRTHRAVSPVRTEKLNASETLKAPEDCEEILGVFTSLSQPIVSDGTVTVIETVDIIYKSVQGQTDCARRTLSIEGKTEKNAVILSALPREQTVRTDENRAEVNTSVEVSYQSVGVTDISCVSAVEADDEAPFDHSAFPTVTLVRAECDDLWMYAKLYHSDVKEIEAVNDIEGDISGKLLLIPKSL